MSNGPMRPARPLSPHLQIYRLSPTMVMSIGHRIAGAGLYSGAVLVACWLVAAAAGPAWLDPVNALLASWFGRLALLSLAFALMFHMLGGLRHLVWDTGRMMEKTVATKLAWATLAGAVLLTGLLAVLAG